MFDKCLKGCLSQSDCKMFTKFFFVKCFTNFYKGVLPSTEDVFSFDQHFTKKKKKTNVKCLKYISKNILQ